jgi:hypothetical protein
MKVKVSIFSGAIALALLAGCGGGHSNDSATAPTPTQPNADAFTQSVQALVATSSETAAPIDITGYAVVANEFGSPIAIY